MTFRTVLISLATLSAAAQAPLLQDGAAALRQAQRDWVAGERPLPPPPFPSFEAGLGGAGSQGPYSPLIGGEGFGHGIRGARFGLQGRYVTGGWSFSATVLGLRDGDRTLGILHRAAVAYQWESGWRLALEQAPQAWGSGLNGGDLAGDSARPFPRLSLASPEVESPWGRWQGEAFWGRLAWNRSIPDWIPDLEARTAALAGGLDLRRPDLYGGILRAAFGDQVEAGLGVVAMEGGIDAKGQTAPADAARFSSLAELRMRIPALARLAGARGAAIHASRGAAPDGRALALNPARDVLGLRLVWEDWDLGMEYAQAADRTPFLVAQTPTYLAGYSRQGDPLGSAFGAGATTRTVELGMPLFLEGRGRLMVVNGTQAFHDSLALWIAAHPGETPASAPFWFFQMDAQWRTPTGRMGASLSSERHGNPRFMQSATPRWGWAFSVFQTFRVF